MNAITRTALLLVLIADPHVVYALAGDQEVTPSAREEATNVALSDENIAAPILISRRISGVDDLTALLISATDVRVASSFAAVTSVPEPIPPIAAGGWWKHAAAGAQYRGRMEAPVGVGATKAGTDDRYYLNRLRFEMSVAANSWLHITGQLQDSEVLGYAAPSAPTSKKNRWDLRLGYVAVEPAGSGVFVRAGRQELNHGSGRLIASPDWGNTNRAFDAIRAGWVHTMMRIEWFSAAPVVISRTLFDQPSRSERVHGVAIVMPKVRPWLAVDQYVFVKTAKAVSSERGFRGMPTCTRSAPGRAVW